MDPKIVNALKASGADANLIKALTSDYASRYWASPSNFVAGSLGQLAASGGAGADNVTNPDTDGFALITHQCFISTGLFLMQLTPTDIGAGLFTAPVIADTLLSILDQPWRLPVPILLRGSDSLRINLVNANGAVANDVYLTTIGYRLIPRNRMC